MWQSLSWIGDVARLLQRHPNLNWDHLLAEYPHPNLRRILYIGLLVAHGTLNAPVPQAMLQLAEQDSASAALAREACGLLFEDSDGKGGMRLKMFPLRLQPGWYGRFSFCATYTLNGYVHPRARDSILEYL
jgi:hypothetical protein